jgi:hypothetical protein
LSAFNVQKMPQTDALADQKAFSRRGVDREIEKIAHEGILPVAHALYPNIVITSGEATGDGFYPKARAYAPDLKHVHSSVIAKKLTDEWKCSNWHSGNDRGMRFPPLKGLWALSENEPLWASICRRVRPTDQPRKSP